MNISELRLETLDLKEIEEGIGLLTLNRPDSLNSISILMLEEFDAVCSALSESGTVRVLVMTGSGRGFCSGADLAAAVSNRENEPFADPERFIRMVQERYADLILKMRRIPQPIIAAINGPAAGGGFCMALASDIRVAVPEAYFVASFANIGLSGGELGTSYLLPRLVGMARAAELLYTGRKLYAEEAEKMGLVNRVAPAGELMDAAMEYARRMAAKNPGVLKFTKRALDQNIDAPSLEAAINLENRNQTMLVFSGEFFKLIQGFSKKPDGHS